MSIKGIVLAGGSGTRLYPLTMATSKQLLPVYDKPMIYYPLSTLMLADIRDILVITTPDDQAAFQRVLGDGSQFGLNLSYAVQDAPRGLADAFRVGKRFIGNSRVCLVLGDNVFYGEGLTGRLQRSRQRESGATIFAANVPDPERFGVVAFNNQGKVTDLVEKPTVPPSSYAVTGLYFYDNQVVEMAASLRPSPRGELEITDINRLYLEQESLHVELMGRGFAWLDTGTYDSLLDAQQFVHTLEARQGRKVACLEEIAYNKGWISALDMMRTAKKYAKNSYGRYLEMLVRQSHERNACAVGEKIFW